MPENFPQRYVPKSAVRVLVPPTVEPVSVAEAREELGADPSDDARLERLIRTARELAEAYTRRAIMRQTLVMQLDAFPGAQLPWWDGVRTTSIRAFHGGGDIALPMPPLLSVAGITYVDLAGDEATVDASDYRVDDVSEPARLLLQPGRAWPVDALDPGLVRVTYDAGYGHAPESVPSAFVDAIMAHVRSAVEQPDTSVSTRRIDNVSVTYGGAVTGSAAAGGGARTGGLRGEAAAILRPFRIMEAA